MEKKMRMIEDGFKGNVATVGKDLRRYLTTTALTAAGLIVLASPSFADNWTDHVANGISVDTSTPNTTNITQSLDFVKVQGDGDINAGWTVNVAQPSSSAKYVLYDTEGDPTEIMGNLNANGRVYIFDQNGVIFGAGSQINVGSIITSTGYVSDQNIQESKLAFEGVGGAGKIVNNGTITVGQAGLAAFVAPGVENSGVINAKMGTVVMASGEKVTLDLYGDNLVEVAVEGKLSNSLIKNKGKIAAEGGNIVLTANAAKNAVDNVINMDGIADVSSVSVQGGKIVLSGGEGNVRVSGKLDASGKNGGGSIDVKGENVEVTSTSVMDMSAIGFGNAGVAAIIARNHMDYRGAVYGRGGDQGGDGGYAEISGYGSMGYSGLVDMGAAGGKNGSLLLDPAFAVIHSGPINDPGALGFLFSAEAIANAMKTTNVTVLATDFIDVGAGPGPYSSGDLGLDTILNTLLGTDPVNLSTWTIGGTGTTTNNLTLEADTINFNKDLVMGTGNVAVNVSTVNLFARLYDVSAAELGDSRIDSTATTVNVQSDAARIQQGIWLAANAGATVNVAEGLYNESILIDKSLALHGVNNAVDPTLGGWVVHSFIIPTGTESITITGDDVTVKGFTISGGNTGIKVDNADNIAIINNTIANVASGVANSGVNIAGGSNIAVNNNLLFNVGGQGIYAEGPFAGPAATLNIAGNLVSSTELHGIYLKNWNGAIIGQNTISGTTAGQGILLELTDNTLVAGNTIGNVAGSGVYLWYGNSNTVVASNTIHNTGWDGITALFNAGLAIVGNLIGFTDTVPTLGAPDNISLDGIHIEGTDGAFVLSNGVAETVGNGLYVGGSNNVVIGSAGAGNVVLNVNLDGIKIDGGDGVKAEHNVTINTGRAGIYAANATNLLVNENSVDGATATVGLPYGGITTDFGSDLTLSGNTVKNSGHGIMMTSAAGTNAISGNKIDLLTDNGIHVQDVAGLSVFGNLIGENGGGVAGHGIFVDPSNVAQLHDNVITDVGGNGIWSLNNDDANIYKNTVTNAGLDGILVQGGNNVTIGGANTTFANTVNGSGDDGIDIENTSGLVSMRWNKIDGTDAGVDHNGVEISGVSGAVISRNTVKNAAWDGINLQQSSGVDIMNNTVEGTQGFSGISVTNGVSDTDLIHNAITGAEQYGVYVGNHTGALLIRNNNIDTVNQNDGVLVTDSTESATIMYNTIDGIQGDAISVNGNNTTAVVNGNFIGFGDDHAFGSVDDSVIGGDGIQLSSVIDGSVNNNRIAHTGGSGINLLTVNANGGVFDIARNVIIDSSSDGIHAEGGSDLFIRNNVIAGVLGGNAGIFMTLASGFNQIFANQIDYITGNGISVVDVTGTADGGDSGADPDTGVVIRRNDIGLTGGANNIGGDGVSVTNSSYAMVRNNHIQNTVGNGVFIDPSDWAVVKSNTISTVGENGIYSFGNSHVTIGGTGLNDKNTIDQTGKNGILIEGGVDNKVQRNVITNTGLGGNAAGDAGNGVMVKDSDDAVVLRNNIGTGVGFANINGDGVLILNSDRTAVKGNTITDTSAPTVNVGNGIQILQSDDVVIGGGGLHTNTISNTAGHGMRIADASNRVTVFRNRIDNAGLSGIHLGLVGEANIRDNDIDGTLSLHGVEVDGGSFITVNNNNIDNTHLDGIRADGVTGLLVNNNDIGRKIGSTIGDDGIEVQTSPDASIRLNVISGTIGNGISLLNSDRADVYVNTVTGAGLNGIKTDGGSDLFIRLNTVTDASTASGGNAGILVTMATGLNRIFRNIINVVDGDGVRVEQVVGTADGADAGFDPDTGALVYRNEIGLTGGVDNIRGNAVSVLNSPYAMIRTNKISNADGNGVFLDSSDQAVVRDNLITDVGNSGIFSLNSANILILNNDISGAGENGIRLEDSTNIELLDNRVNNSGLRGLYASGQNNGLIILKRNSFAGNPVGAEFESGEVDLTALGPDVNSFDGGDVGLRFDPKGGLGGDPLKLLLTGNTIGGTVFTGQSTYYVELLNRAFFEPGSPTIIDALNASYDGFVPISVGGVLTQAKYDELESKFYHFNDDGSLGLFFFGFVPDIDESLIFNRFGAFNGDLTGFNVRITGLPTIPGGTPGPFGLNNIATFAGGNTSPQGLNAIETAAGGDETQQGSSPSPQDLGAIETAGGGNSGCWGNAADIAGNGQSVDVSYQGSISDNLDQAASCGGSF